MQLRLREQIRRDLRIVPDLPDDIQRDAVRDVELAARERVGDVARAADVEPEHQLVEQRLVRFPVIAIANESHALSFDDFLDAKWSRARWPEAHPLLVARLLDRHDAA